MPRERKRRASTGSLRLLRIPLELVAHNETTGKPLKRGLSKRPPDPENRVLGSTIGRGEFSNRSVRRSRASASARTPRLQLPEPKDRASRPITRRSAAAAPGADERPSTAAGTVQLATRTRDDETLRHHATEVGTEGEPRDLGVLLAPAVHRPLPQKRKPAPLGDLVVPDGDVLHGRIDREVVAADVFERGLIMLVQPRPRRLGGCDRAVGEVDGRRRLRPLPHSHRPPHRAQGARPWPCAPSASTRWPTSRASPSSRVHAHCAEGDGAWRLMMAKDRTACNAGTGGSEHPRGGWPVVVRCSCWLYSFGFQI